MSKQFLRLHEVMKKTGKSRSAIYCDMAEGRFPKQIKIGERTICWDLDEIEQWQADCIENRDLVA